MTTQHTSGTFRVLNGKLCRDCATACIEVTPIDTRNSLNELLAALRELVERCDGEEGVRADGSNIQTMAAHAAIEKAEGKE
jgi:hypothetical protein